MEIRSCQSADIRELLALYASVGWTNYTRSPDMLRDAFAHSLLALGAYEEGQLVGLIRCVGDGCSVVFIQDLLVRPDFQRRGIGKALVNDALKTYSKVYQIQLLTDDTPQTAVFYEALGFRRADRLGCVSYVKMR